MIHQCRRSTGNGRPSNYQNQGRRGLPPRFLRLALVSLLTVVTVASTLDAFLGWPSTPGHLATTRTSDVGDPIRGTWWTPPTPVPAVGMAFSPTAPSLVVTKQRITAVPHNGLSADSSPSWTPDGIPKALPLVNKVPPITTMAPKVSLRDATLEWMLPPPVPAVWLAFQPVPASISVTSTPAVAWFCNSCFA